MSHYFQTDAIAKANMLQQKLKKKTEQQTYAVAIISDIFPLQFHCYMFFP